MKHKAQECFERIYQQDYEVFDSSCLVAVEDSDMRYEEDCDTIQDLINCQLTGIEIYDCLIALALFEQRFPMDGLSNRFECLKSKLNKQKEMWVSDDETN